MAVLNIAKIGEEVLRKKAENVKKIDLKIKNFCQDMIETMYCYKGIGLAAVQVKVLKNIIVIDIVPEKKNPIVVVNPKIIKAEGKIEGIEGCLSVPGREGSVERSQKVTLEGMSLSGKKKIIKAEGLLARVIQHEIDHLNGILFIDKIMDEKRTGTSKLPL